MKGILADVHMRGPAADLFRAMQTDGWADFWDHLHLVAFHFEDVGLVPTSTDLEIWQTCQEEHLVFITNNSNEDSADSLETTIRRFGSVDSLPVFTIGSLDRFRFNREYAFRVLERFFEYLLDIDSVRGTGRLFLP